MVTGGDHAAIGCDVVVNRQLLPRHLDADHLVFLAGLGVCAVHFDGLGVGAGGGVDLAHDGGLFGEGAVVGAGPGHGLTVGGELAGAGHDAGAVVVNPGADELARDVVEAVGALAVVGTHAGHFADGFDADVVAVHDGGDGGRAVGDDGWGALGHPHGVPA